MLIIKNPFCSNPIRSKKKRLNARRIARRRRSPKRAIFCACVVVRERGKFVVHFFCCCARPFDPKNAHASSCADFIYVRDANRAHDRHTHTRISLLCVSVRADDLWFSFERTRTSECI